MDILYCPCRFRLPLNYNDGREVEAEVLLEIFRALARQFGGYTPLGTAESGWEQQGGPEPTMGVEVAVLPSRVAELEAVVVAIGKQLGQKQMYFDAPPPSVRFLDTEQEESESKDVDKNKTSEEAG
jgi:hypothetical protein